MTRKLHCFLAALALAGACFAQSTQTATPTPPAYTVLRWNEDYSYLKDPALRSDFFDPVKYIPLGENKDFYLSLGGQVRYRYEYFDNNNFGLGPQDSNGFHLLRTMAHADLHLGPNIRAFVQGISALADGRNGGDRPSDENELDLHQGFLDLRLPLADRDSLTLRGGRQNLLYGAQRLISPLDWANTRRTFDGFRSMLVTGNNQLDFFLVRPVTVNPNEFDHNDEESTFTGLYDSLQLPGVFGKAAGTRLEAYALGLFKNLNNPASIDSDTYTLGTRFYTNPKPWDLDVEADYQFGEYGDGDISAWSFAIEAGYTFANLTLTPRAFLGFDIASGDRNPNDNDLETFNQLFPLGHAYFGYIDVIGRQNIIDLHPGAVLNFTKALNLRAEYHLFWRQSIDDGLYNSAGTQLFTAAGSDSRFIGSEIDLLLNWQINRHLLAYIGYSHFFTGAFIDDAGAAADADDDIDFFYTALQFTF